MDELKPCPFCGGKVKSECLNKIHETDFVINHHCFYLGILIQTMVKKTEEESIEAWNKRSSQ